ncbi:MAG: sigma-70 family RNA polymerase sigma factor [Bacteroidales bacterium]|nr:sigma-70 family RNA polymerase sigma factor [Bacteroidales bacterium]
MTRKEFETDIIPLSSTLYRYAFRFLSSKEGAEDAVQEVFLKLWKKRDKLSGYNSVQAFAMTVTRNHCLDSLRKKKMEFFDDTGKDEARASDMNLEKSLENSEKFRIISGIIDTLPENYRTVIQLRDIEGYEYEELSEKLKMDINNLRVILSRARKMVREEIKKKNYELVSA